MKREIKFRAWHFIRKRMFSVEEMVLDQMALLPDGRFANIHSVSTAKTRIFSHEEMLPLQYTGLKDKHGKEIFEGDLVTVPYVDPMGRLHKDEVDGEKSGVVVFEDGLFGIKYRNHVAELKGWCKSSMGEYVSNYGIPRIFENNTYLEIIGNKFQNPELLGGQNEIKG